MQWEMGQTEGSERTLVLVEQRPQGRLSGFLRCHLFILLLLRDGLRGMALLATAPLRDAEWRRRFEDGVGLVLVALLRNER